MGTGKVVSRLILETFSKTRREETWGGLVSPCLVPITTSGLLRAYEYVMNVEGIRSVLVVNNVGNAVGELSPTHYGRQWCRGTPWEE